MLFKLPLLCFFIFGVTYPMFFWLTAKDPIKHNFLRFHLATPVIAAGLAIAGLWLVPVPQEIRFWSAAWLVCALIMTAMFWNKDKVHLGTVTVVCLWGLKLFAVVYQVLVGGDGAQLGIFILSGFLVSSIFYAMNLGHFYLNVHGLKIDHLKTATMVFGALMGARLLWDIYYAATQSVMVGGEMQTVLSFMNSTDGFLLWAAVFFGTVFPLIGLYFAFGTLKLKNTQATTGILYALLSAVLLGDLAYKYFLLQYGIAM